MSETQNGSKPQNENTNILPLSENLPFEIKSFLDALNDSSSRSRNILLVLIFSSLLILMALVNSLKPQMNWYKSRSEVLKRAAKHLIFPTDNIEDTYHNLPNVPYSNFQEYIIANELLQGYRPDSNELVKINKLAQKNILINNVQIFDPRVEPVQGSSFLDRFETYKHLSDAIHMVNTHTYINKENLLNYINELDEVEVGNMRLVRVPILGVSFEVNYLGIYGGFTILICNYLGTP